MKKICVFCGSSPGALPDYTAAARDLARLMVKSGIGLVYGGGNVGLMGELAATFIEEGGEVTGVIPGALAEKEVAHTELDDLRIVGSMHERKALMAELSDGFIALPGGLGTLEEFFEMVTWGQLGIHHKPCGLLDVAGYFSRLTDFLDHCVAERFIQPEYRSMIMLETEPGQLLDRLRSYSPPRADKTEWALGMSES